jgi:hypothetical protein
MSSWVRIWAVIVGAGIVVGLVSGLIPIQQYVQEKTQDPIRIDYGRLLNATCTLSATVKGPLDPSKDINYYKNNGLLIYPDATLQLDVVSKVEDETIKVAPYLLIQITDIKSVPKTVDYIREYVGGCGGGSPDQFEAAFSPNRDKVFGTPQSPLWREEYPDKAEEKPFGYFTLTPGEREVFQIHFRTLPGHYYRFRIGVQYSYEGDESIAWSTKKFVVGAPTKPTKAGMWATGFTPLEKCPPRSPCVFDTKGRIVKYESLPEQVRSQLPRVLLPDPGEIREQIKQEEQEIQRYQSSFKTP